MDPPCQPGSCTSCTAIPAAVAVLAFVCMRKRKRGRETDYRLDVIEPGERFSGAVAPTAPKSALTASMVAPGPLLPATPVVRLPNACGAVPFATAPSGGTDGAPAACAASLPPGPGLGAPLAAGPLASGPLARGLITSLGSAPVTPAGSAPATPLTFSAPAAAASQTATDTSRASLDIDRWGAVSGVRSWACLGASHPHPLRPCAALPCSKALSQDPLLTYLKTRNEVCPLVQAANAQWDPEPQATGPRTASACFPLLSRRPLQRRP